MSLCHHYSSKGVQRPSSGQKRPILPCMDRTVWERLIPCLPVRLVSFLANYQAMIFQTLVPLDLFCTVHRVLVKVRFDVSPMGCVAKPGQPRLQCHVESNSLITSFTFLRSTSDLAEFWLHVSSYKSLFQHFHFPPLHDAQLASVNVLLLSNVQD